MHATCTSHAGLQADFDTEAARHGLGQLGIPLSR
jgi:hypothetical protein